MLSRVAGFIGRVIEDTREFTLTLGVSDYTNREYASLHFGWAGVMLYAINGSILALGVNWRDGFARLGPISIGWGIPGIVAYSQRFSLNLTLYGPGWSEFDVFEFVARKGNAVSVFQEVKA